MTACPTCGAEPCTNSDFCQSCRATDAKRAAEDLGAQTKESRRCPYEVLGVQRDATIEQIKKAFRKLVNELHPDRNPDNKEECTRRLIEINEAYEILKDPEQRTVYDRYGFSARGLGAAKQQRDGGFNFEDILAELFKKIPDLLVDIARRESELFHDADNEPYAHAKVGGHRETYHVRSRSFALWLRQRYFQKYKTSVNANAMTEALATVTMFAVCEGPELPVHIRIAEHADAIYIDIGDKNWNAVEVTSTGWRLVANPPVRFARSSSMRPLPTPKTGGSIEALRKFVNVKPRNEENGADEFVLLVAYALAALRPNCNYPVLGLAGEQGSGKTSLVRFLGSLIDPRSPQLRTMPGDERDLIVAARHAHLLGFDNISGLSDDMSDAICRLSTGGGHGERELYTNREESTFEGRRPVCLNGIEDVATRPDLVDRALMLLLVAIGPDGRRDERDFEKEFATAASEIFGALLDGLSAGLRNLATMVIADKPRMADFALWAEACTQAYWTAGTFMRAYQENIAAANEVVIEASAVGDAVRHFMSGRIRWEGTASELLRVLTPLVPEALARERSWPKSARALSGKLRRAASPLRKVGIDVTFVREGHDRERTIVITARSIGVDNFASAPSAETEKSEKHTNGKELDADANADGMRTQTSDGPSADNHRKNNGFSQNGGGADDADANSATSARSANSVPSDYGARSPPPEVCDYCGHPADHQALQTIADDWRQARLHRRCEGPWFDSAQERPR